MATAEEILAGMTAEETQQVLVIDNDLRRITIPEGVRLLGVTSDDDVLRLRFTMPRVYGEVDLSGFAIRINYLNAGSEGDVYPVDDAQTDGDVIRFTWLVGRHACKFAGDVRFIICLKRSEGGEVAQEYNTTLATLPVLEGLETGEAVAQAHPDVIEAILKRLDTLEQEGGGVSAEAIAAAVAAYLTEHPVEPGATAEQAAQIEANRQAIEELKQSGTGGITEETDPTVPDWAKQPNKPTYAAIEVGARPDTWMPSASEVGADAAGTASGAVAAHNVSGAAHADLRALIDGLTSRLNALADSDDTTLDQLSEIVAYIKSNKALIDAVTTGKVSVSDIVDNLTTNASGKVLSAAQGVALKGLIDAIVIPDKLPNPQPLTINGQRYDGSEAVTMTTVEIDDTMTQSGKAADAKAVGDQLSALNEANAQQDTEIVKKANDADLAKVAKSGSYNDLTGKPTIPTVPSALPNPNELTFTGAVTGSYDGSAPMSVEIPSGGGGSSGGSGKAKSQILIDQEITELTASLSVTLEHDFHNLTAIINSGSAGADLTADSGGAAIASNICLLIDTTSFSYNSRKVVQIEISTGMWKNVMFGAEWSDDLSVFKRGGAVEIATNKKQSYSFTFGGASAMYGTLGTDDNAPRTGKTANIVVKEAYLNVGTRVVLWGEYYE